MFCVIHRWAAHLFHNRQCSQQEACSFQLFCSRCNWFPTDPDNKYVGPHGAVDSEKSQVVTDRLEGQNDIQNLSINHTTKFSFLTARVERVSVPSVAGVFKFIVPGTQILLKSKNWIWGVYEHWPCWALFPHRMLQIFIVATFTCIFGIKFQSVASNSLLINTVGFPVLTHWLLAMC